MEPSELEHDALRSIQRLESIAVQQKADQTINELEALLADIRSSSITTPRRQLLVQVAEDHHEEGPSHGATSDSGGGGQATGGGGGNLKAMPGSRFMQVRGFMTSEHHHHQ